MEISHDLDPIQLAERFDNPRLGSLVVSNDLVHFYGGMIDGRILSTIKIFLMMNKVQIEYNDPYLYWYSDLGVKYVIYPGTVSRECRITTDGRVRLGAAS